MSLDFNYSKVRNSEELLVKKGDGYREKGAPDVMLEALIFSTMAVGMGSIKDEKEAVEFFARLSFFEKARGAMRAKLVDGKREEVYFALDEVRRCIGLSTNVGKESKASFLKRLFENHARDVERAARAETLCAKGHEHGSVEMAKACDAERRRATGSTV